MKELLTKKHIIIIILLLPIWISSLANIYEDRNKIVNTLNKFFTSESVETTDSEMNNENPNNLNDQENLTNDLKDDSQSDDNEDYDETFIRNQCFSDYACNSENEVWAKEIMKGGYILHFRHAERDKWIDVKMYDALETDVHDLGKNQSRLAENDYFKDAVCLNSRGEIQAKAMGEHLSNINFPVGYIISSPSCRSRQTAEIVFGGYDDLDRFLVHRGPYKETGEAHVENLIRIYKNLPLENNKNTIVSSHNGVIDPRMFVKSVLDTDQYSLEEGGFYVIQNTDEGLKLVHKFYTFQEFIKEFYPRG